MVTLATEPAASAQPVVRWPRRATDWVGANPVVVAVIAVAFCLRLAWLLAVDPSAPTDFMRSGDQFSYYYYGREIARGDGYVSYITGQPTAYYPIGYPALLAIVFWLVDHTPFTDDHLFAAQLTNVVVSTASVILGALVARKLFGATAGVVAAIILATFPNLVFQVASVQLETMFIFWILLALWVLVGHDWSTGLPSTARLAVFGAVLGVSVLIRPFSAWFVVGVVAAGLVAGAGWKRSLRAAAVPVLIIVAMSVPWAIRNAVQMDALLVTSSNTGDTLCLDRSEDATGAFRWADHAGCADPSLPEVERNSANIRKAVGFVVEHPVREVVQIGRRARLMLASDHDGIEAVNTLGGGAVLSASTSRTLSDVADRYFWVVLALAPVGLIVALRSSRRRRPELTFVLVALSSLVAIPLLLWGNPRFHLPFSPLLAVLAAGAVAASIDLVRRPVARRAPERQQSVGSSASTSS